LATSRSRRRRRRGGGESEEEAAVEGEDSDDDEELSVVDFEPGEGGMEYDLDTDSDDNFDDM
jgi:hypothetical protein